MSEQSSKKGTMAKDTIVYMAAKGIEGVVGVVTMSVMTYLFAASKMGRYSTVNIAITTIGMVCIQWLVQSVLRYINKYDIEKKLDEFYTTVFSAWLCVNVLVAVGAMVLLGVLRLWFGSVPAVAGFTRIYTYQLIFFGILWFVSYNSAELMISMLAALREAKLNLLLSMIRVCGKLGFMYALCKLYGSKIEWIFLSYFITDTIVALIGMCRLKIYKYINFRNRNKNILQELKSYGMPLMGNQLATSVLNKSDIYIITAIVSDVAAGIYSTNYSLIATAFTLLNASVMRGSYPTILRTWSEGDKPLTERLIGEAVRFYMLIAVPAVVGVAAVSDTVAGALFEESYFEGHAVMFWVALGMFFLGLTEYSIKYWELNAKTKSIFARSLISGVVNVGLNLIFITVFKNYMIAAVTTFIGFFVYFLMARFGTRKYMKWHVKPLVYVRIVGSALVMYIAIALVKLAMHGGKTLVHLGLYVIFGVIVYAVAIIASGEVKNELAVVMNKIKK
jgi:O-antigen/teichoic acid export membrane protein